MRHSDVLFDYSSTSRFPRSEGRPTLLFNVPLIGHKYCLSPITTACNRSGCSSEDLTSRPCSTVRVWLSIARLPTLQSTNSAIDMRPAKSLIKTALPVVDCDLFSDSREEKDLLE